MPLPAIRTSEIAALRRLVDVGLPGRVPAWRVSRISLAANRNPVYRSPDGHAEESNVTQSSDPRELIKARGGHAV